MDQTHLFLQLQASSSSSSFAHIILCTCCVCLFLRDLCQKHTEKANIIRLNHMRPLARAAFSKLKVYCGLITPHARMALLLPTCVYPCTVCARVCTVSGKWLVSSCCHTSLSHTNLTLPLRHWRELFIPQPERKDIIGGRRCQSKAETLRALVLR